MVPEDELRRLQRAAQLAGEGHAVPQADVLLPAAQDGSGRSVDPQPGGESLHTIRGGRLALIAALVPLPDRAQLQRPLGAAGRVQQPEPGHDSSGGRAAGQVAVPLIGGEGGEAVGENAVVREPDPADLPSTYRTVQRSTDPTASFSTLVTVQCSRTLAPVGTLRLV